MNTYDVKFKVNGRTYENHSVKASSETDAKRSVEKNHAGAKVEFISITAK